MSLWWSLVLGAVQGLTEFLPVSSSGHLALAQMTIEGFRQPGVVFDAMLHLGTAFAVVWYERRNIVRWIGALEGRRLLAVLVLGTLATAVLAFPLRQFGQAAFERVALVGGLLVVTGCVVAVTRWLPGGGSQLESTRWFQAALVGLVQGVAVLPGLSRSGVTIATGLAAGLERTWAARLSFLLSVPAILGVTVFELVAQHQQISAAGPSFWLACGVGAVTAAITGYLALKIVVYTISSRSFHRFAWYTVPLGLLVAALSVGWS